MRCIVADAFHINTIKVCMPAQIPVGLRLLCGYKLTVLRCFFLARKERGFWFYVSLILHACRIYVCCKT